MASRMLDEVNGLVPAFAQPLNKSSCGGAGGGEHRSMAFSGRAQSMTTYGYARVWLCGNLVRGPSPTPSPVRGRARALAYFRRAGPPRLIHRRNPLL
jgi:hypothetical protein